MKVPFGYVTKVVEIVAREPVHSATKYCAPDLVVRAVRRLYKGKIARHPAPLEIALHIGRPNYLERRFIKLCKRAGEPFPVKKIQLTLLPKRRG
jgi:hypothetical protein